MYDSEGKIQREIIRRALEKSKDREQKRQVQDVVDALDEMTDLSRDELNRIADRVIQADSGDRDQFFSVRQQLFMAGATLLLFGMLFVWLF